MKSFAFRLLFVFLAIRCRAFAELGSGCATGIKLHATKNNSFSSTTIFITESDAVNYEMESLAACLLLLLISIIISYLFCCCGCCHFFIHFNLCACVCAQLLADFLSQFNHLGIQTVISKSKPSQSTPNFNSCSKPFPFILRMLCDLLVASGLCACVFPTIFFVRSSVRRIPFNHQRYRSVCSHSAQQPHTHTNSKSIREQNQRRAKSPYLYKTRSSLL